MTADTDRKNAWYFMGMALGQAIKGFFWASGCIAAFAIWGWPA